MNILSSSGCQYVEFGSNTFQLKNGDCDSERNYICKGILTIDLWQIPDLILKLNFKPFCIRVICLKTGKIVLGSSKGNGKDTDLEYNFLMILIEIQRIILKQKENYGENIFISIKRIISDS